MTGPLALSTGVLSQSSVLIPVAILCATYILYKLFALTSYIRHLREIYKDAPGPEHRHWLYGNMHLFPTPPPDRFRYMMSLATRFRRYFCVWFGPARVVVIVNHPDTVKAVLKASSSKPTGFSGSYRFALPWLGKGLLIADGARWSRSRRLLTPAFHFDILKPYVSVYNDAVSKMITATSVSCSELAEIWFQRERRLHLYPDFIFNLTSDGRRFSKHCDYVHSVAEEIISKRKEALEKENVSERKYLDFLDIMLTAKDEHGNGMSLLDIRNEVDTFMFEGHDTTATGISWTLYSLAKHPQYQRKVQEEVDSIMTDQNSDLIEWSDLSKFEYLTMCIKESLRHHSPVPFIQRELSRDLTLDGRVLPVNTPVALHIYGLHHNKDVWQEPDEYRPERFSKENVAKMDSHQFIPFSAGPRNCIGQHFALNEEKVVIARLLKRFTFRLDDNHAVHLKTSAVLRSMHGVKLYVTKR